MEFGVISCFAAGSAGWFIYVHNSAPLAFIAGVLVALACITAALAVADLKDDL